MTTISNLQQINALALFEEAEGAQKDKVHLRTQQRNGRKSITTVVGLSDDLDLKMITKALKKKFSCTGTVIKDPSYGKLIKLSGDQRAKIFHFFAEESICCSDQMVIH